MNIQNLERKTIILNKSNHVTKLQKTIRLCKNNNVVEDDIYYYIDTSTNVEQTFTANNFIGSFLNAYNTHSDVVLNPDNIWLMILLFLSKYIDTHAEILRSKFVTHEGQKSLVITEYADSIEESLAMEKEWDYFYEQIHEQVKNNTHEGIVDSLKCDFSTTGVVEKIISTSVIMNSFKKYFTYERCIMDCGIDNIYFQGTRDDWVKIIKKTENIAKYDVDTKLTKYVVHVLIILNQFINAWDS